MLGKISTKKLVSILAIVFIASGLIAGIIFFVQYGISGFSFENLDTYENEVNVEKKADLQAIEAIHVESTFEDIKLIKSDSNEAKAHFYGGYSSSSKSYEPELLIEKNGEILLIKIEDDANGFTLGFRSNLQLDVYIPSQFSGSLDVKTVSGEVAVGELSVKTLLLQTTSGDVDTGTVNAEKAVIDTTSGEINIEGRYSELSIKSTSGDINSNIIDTDTLNLESDSGEIKISGKLINITAQNISGDISLSSSCQPGLIRITTVSGETELKLPDSEGFKLTCQSVSGDMHTDFPVTITGTVDKSEHELSGTTGNGSGEVSVSSTSGDISILKQ